MNTLWLKRLGGPMLSLLIAIALLSSVVIISQARAHTPPILGADDNPLPGSIAVQRNGLISHSPTGNA